MNDQPTLPKWVDDTRGAEAGSCRSCRAPIWWVFTRSGKRAPIDADGTSHFATCPQADRWRTPR